VAQMLNLDALGAIAFEKGCYTGQEIIARAHYRGKVKRRLQRFLVAAPARLGPGDEGVLGDGRPFKVVDAAQREDGGCEFLAVTTRAAGDAPAAGAVPLSAQILELPYALPE
jgi:folate-binding Fe-S cluster repair protein YgfZ